MGIYQLAINLSRCVSANHRKSDTEQLLALPLVGGRRELARLLAHMDRRHHSSVWQDVPLDAAVRRVPRGYRGWYNKLRHIQVVDELSARYGLRFHRDSALSHQWSVSRIKTQESEQPTPTD